LEIICQKTLDLIAVQSTQKKLVQQFEIDDVFRRTKVLCDSQRLSQVLVSILSNALKFTYSGNIKLKVESVNIKREIKNRNFSSGENPESDMEFDEEM
jgi:signal transduction histidine kinase